MTIQEIFDLAITLGIKADLRGESGVKKSLKQLKKTYEELPKKKQEYFDQEALVHPYADSRILFGDPSTNVDKVLAGIDIGSGEMTMADRLNEKGEGIDLIIGHHPVGVALAGLFEVMDLLVDMQVQAGVPVNVAEALLSKRIEQVRRRVWPVNHNQAVDAARLLNIPLMTVHTPTDNLVSEFLTKGVEKTRPETVADVIEMLLAIPEYKEAAKGKAGPTLYVGAEKNRAGRVVVDMTGGTEGAKELFEKMSHAGVGTIVGMHASEDNKEEAEKHHINLVIAGHMVSDSLGMNLFLDELEKKGIGILPCSGLIRVSRSKAK